MAEMSLEPLKGVVEIDETYIGGKRRHVGKGYIGYMAMVSEPSSAAVMVT